MGGNYLENRGYKYGACPRVPVSLVHISPPQASK